MKGVFSEEVKNIGGGVGSGVDDYSGEHSESVSSWEVVENGRTWEITWETWAIGGDWETDKAVLMVCFGCCVTNHKT